MFVENVKIFRWINSAENVGSVQLYGCGATNDISLRLNNGSSLSFAQCGQLHPHYITLDPIQAQTYTDSPNIFVNKMQNIYLCLQNYKRLCEFAIFTSSEGSLCS